jgi:hypothetical protein
MSIFYKLNISKLHNPQPQKSRIAMDLIIFMTTTKRLTLHKPVKQKEETVVKVKMGNPDTNQRPKRRKQKITI